MAMSGLRGMTCAASVVPKHWRGLSFSILRHGLKIGNKDSPPLPNLEATFSTSANSCSSNSGGNKESPPQQPPQHDNNSTGWATPTDRFEDVINATRRLFSPSFGRDCQHRLLSWHRQANLVMSSGKPVDLTNIVSDFFPDVVEFSLTQLAPVDVRVSVLKLLLTQQSDDDHMTRMLQSTVSDVMQLPIASVAEIVRLLSVAAPTELRTEARRSLVMAVVNRRWYELPAKHLVFFMFQCDELFQVRAMLQQLRQKSRAREKLLKNSRRQNPDKLNNNNKQDSNLINSVGEASSTHHNSAGNVERVAGNPDNNESQAQDISAANRESVLDKRDTSGKDGAHSDDLPSLTCVNLESRAITLADELKVKDLARVVSLLSRWGGRNEPLLSACLHRLSLADLSDFTAVQLGNLLQAMATLNLHNSSLLQNLSTQLEKDDFRSKPSASQACAVLSSLSALCWAGAKTQDSESQGLALLCLLYLGDQLDRLTVKEAAGVLTSLANLAVTPTEERERTAIKALASLVLNSKSPWWSHLQCVWCLCVLQCVEADTARRVLDPAFVQQVLHKVQETKTVTSAHKLAQINMAARLEVKGYDGPFLSEEQLQLCLSQPQPSADHQAGKTALLKSLRKFVDLVTYVDLSPTLPGGVCADVLMCANQEGEVRPLSAIENSTELVHKLAVQYVPFSGVVSPDQTTRGQYCMSARHLSQLGYVPVQILYSDLKRSLSMLEKVSNIKSRIKSAAAQASRNTTPSSSSCNSASGSRQLEIDTETKPS